MGFLDVLTILVDANDGIPMVWSARFPHTSEPGALLQVTDANGEDGAGGYAFHSSTPGVVYVVHTEWPSSVRAALAAAARPRQLRARDQSRVDMLSVPAAELAISWLVPFVVQARTGLAIESITAVGDCLPVARVLSSASSPSPQTRALVRQAYGLCRRWMALAVKRERNGSADELTHPELAAAVGERARSAGWEVEVLTSRSEDVPVEVWQAILAAARLPMGRETDAITVCHRRSPHEESAVVAAGAPGQPVLCGTGWTSR